jgi:hypothetical protein
MQPCLVRSWCPYTDLRHDFEEFFNSRICEDVVEFLVCRCLQVVHCHCRYSQFVYLVQLSQTFRGNDILISWIQTCQQESLSILEYLGSIEKYCYNTGNDEDSAVPHPIIIEFEKTLTSGRPRVRLPRTTITTYRSQITCGLKLRLY